jgi:hypothetical protein
VAVRRRKAIPLEQQLAAALVCLLPQEQRDALRHARVPAKQVIRLFSPDHIWLWSLGGPDAWWNLDPKLRPAHAVKSRRDTSIAAKIKRLDKRRVDCSYIPEVGEAWFRKARLVMPRKIAQRKNPWPPKGSRPFRPSP